MKSRTPASNPLSLLVEILDWLLAGDRELAEIFPEEAQAQHIVYFRDAEWHDDPVRVAYMFMFEPQAPHRRVVVQVGETLNKRKRLSNEIIAGIIIPQFFLFPVVALLAWFGLQRGTLPLERLRQRLLSRRPGDLSPINVREVPEEVAPLIEAFNGVMERLSTTMRAQERFIADAAHQMRTPLAGLRTQLEFALRQRDPADLRASLERIRSSVERATRMISQLLSLARSQSETPPKFEPVAMNALAREVTQEWVEQALAKRIDLGFEGAPGPAMVEGSRLLLHELLNNLVDNAVRYTPPGGRVTAARGGGQLDPRRGQRRDRGQRRRHRRARPRTHFRALLPRRRQRGPRHGARSADRALDRCAAPGLGAGASEPLRARQRVYGDLPRLSVVPQREAA